MLEQDRVIVEGAEVPESELLYQHDIGVTQVRRLMARRAKDYLKSLDAPRAAAE